RTHRVPMGLEFFAMLKSLRAVIGADRDGGAMTRSALLALQPGLTDEQLNHALEHLRAQRVLHIDDKQQLTPLREPEDVSLLELFEGGRYAWPTGHDIARLATLADASDKPLVDLLAELHSALAPPLRQSAEAALEPLPLEPEHRNGEHTAAPAVTSDEPEASVLPAAPRDGEVHERQVTQVARPAQEHS
ncbi:MAG: hypothetical protein ABIP49_01155, partial [Lysobacterales bacterium]